MIVAEGLTKHFDDFIAVEELSLYVGEGELLALLGPNGAGKTTTVRMLSGILQPTSGRASIKGHDILKEADQVRRQIGMLTEQPGLYTRSTGLEYLIFFGRLYGMTDAQITKRGLGLFDRFAMPNTAHRRLGEYSKGMRQKVGLIRAMLHDPAVLLLDEPTSAMDPQSAKIVRDAIMEMRNDRRAIILCTHNLAEAELLADRIAIIKQGRIVAEDEPATLKKQLLGRPQVEVQLDRPLNGQVHELEELVAVEWVRDNRICYRADDPVATNPKVVQCLVGLGLGVVSLAEITKSLEDVYLSVVTDDLPVTAVQPEDSYDGH
jgi:ABC-2 type transport system ATP-binding protein